MVRYSRIGGWLIVFMIVGALSGLVFQFGSKSGPSTNGATLAPAPASKAAGQPASPAVTEAAPKVAEQQAVAKNAPKPPHEAKPRSRWMDGETLWISPPATAADGTLSRVRLLKTGFGHPLIRVEEQLTPGANGGAPTITGQNAMVADHLLVKLAPGADAARLAESARAVGGSLAGLVHGSDIYVVKISSADGQSLPGAIQALEALKGTVAYASPDHIVHATATPNDSYFGTQWALHNTAQYGGVADADIDAPEAWDITTGSSAVVVAVLDSGMTHTLADLAPNVWSNPGEIAGNGVDDDGNGYTDDVRGWNFLNGNATTTDSQYHGTQVAGIIGAAGNQGVGISGVAWEVKLMPLKFLDSSGFGTTSAAISAINYARVKGAHIINHSWGGPSFSQPLKDAIDAAGAAGILNVCAADNGSGKNEDLIPNYPSSFTSPSVISVASTTSADILSTTSNYGPASVHLAAPGQDILTTYPNGAHYPASGTSMAAPHVSGIAALLKSHKPGLTGTDMKAIMQTSVDMLPVLTGRLTTSGRANARRALDWASDISVAASSGAQFSGNHGGPFAPATLFYTLKNQGTSSAAWTAEPINAYYISATPSSGTLAAGESVTVTVNFDTALANSAAPGFYNGSLRISNTTSGKSTTWPMQMDVRLPHIYFYDLNTDPGWAREETWEFGTPQGRGANGSGFADPTAGRTGTNVFGANLQGSIPYTVNGPHALTAGPFDLRGYTQTKLNFWRWLNAYASTPHSVQIRHEGSTAWTTLWSLSNTYGGYAMDNTWTEQTLDLGPAGDGRSAVYIRWVYESLYENPGYSPLTGWNIDDIKITGQPGSRLFIDGPAGVNENAGTATITLHVEPASPVPLTVALASGDATAATLPTTVTVPANTRSISVQATVVDDILLDGTQTTTLTPAAAGFVSIPWNLEVWDNETSSLTLNVPASATEGGTVQATASMAAPAGRSVAVKLLSSLPSTAKVPAIVVIPAGQTQTAFTITLSQNGLMENHKNVQITATVANWTGASASINVMDDDLAPPTLVFPRSAGGDHFAEGRSTSNYVATVTLPAPRMADTVISLTMDDSTEFNLPASVTIPAGTLSANISPVVVNDDTLQDGMQTVVVTASAPGIPSGTASVTVADNEVVGFRFGYIYSPQELGGQVCPWIYALDSKGLLAHYNGTATVTALVDGVPDAAFGSVAVTFSNGFNDALFSLPTQTAAYALKAVNGPATGTSNTFSIQPSSLRSVSLAANDLAYDPQTNRVYASTSSGTVVPIHPDTGAMEAPITVGTGAVGQIEVAASGGVLYAVVSNRSQLVKVDLVARTAGTPFGFGGTLTVADFAILPNDSNTVGLVFDHQASGTVDRVAIYTEGVKRPGVISYDPAGTDQLNITEITAGGMANRFYASNADSASITSSIKTLCLLDVNAGGVALNRSYAVPGTLANLTSSGSMVADDSGRVFDGESGNSLGRVGDNDTDRASLILDETIGRASRIIRTGPATYYPFGLSVFELTGFSETDRKTTDYNTPVMLTSPARPSRIVKAGTRGVAYRGATSVTLAKSSQLLDPAQPAPDLVLQQIACPTLSDRGKPMSFNMLVRNHGNAPAANVELTSDWTPGAEYLGSSTSKGTVTRAGARVVASLGTLAVGEAATVCVQLRATDCLNRAAVTTSTAETYTLNNSHLLNTYLSGQDQPYAGMALNTADLASSKTTGRVYATQGFGNGFFAGTLAVLDLDAPAVRAFVPVGSGPGAMALAENQTDLHIALDGTGHVLPLNVITLTSGTAFSLGTGADGRRLFVGDMVARPGHAGHVVISRKDIMKTQSGVGLFVNGSLRGSPTPASETMLSLAASTDGSTCYCGGTDSYTFAPAPLHRLTLSDAGVALAQTRADAIIGRRLHFASGKLLGSYGRIFDATTLADAGMLDTPTAYGGSIAQGLVHDPERERLFAKTEGNSPAFVAYQSQNLNRTTQTHVNLNAAPDRMVRWGDHGLAMSATVPQHLYGIYWINDETLVPEPPVNLDVPAFITENAGTLSGGGTLRLTVAPAADLTFTLISSRPDLLQVPATVTVPAGQTTAAFNLTLVNDAVINGARSVTLTPGGVTGYVLQPVTVEVRDDENGGLGLTLPSSLNEGAGVVTGQTLVTLSNGPAAADILVQLSSSRTDKLTVPATITIPAGQGSAVLPLTLLDDDYVDGTQVVTITANVGGWSSAVRNIDVLDNNASTISLGFGSTVQEGLGSLQVQAQFGGKAVQNVVVTLTSSHPEKISVPASITVPAGQVAVNFNATIAEDLVKDGRVPVTITASAAGFTTSPREVVVIDNDLAILQWASISNVTVGAIIPVTVTGTTLAGDPAKVANALTVTPVMALNGTPATGMSGTLSNTTTPIFRGNIRVTQAGAGMVLSATVGDVTGSSNAFTISAGPMSGFVWDAVSGQPEPNTPFPVTVRAADGYGNALTSFTGTAGLSAFQNAFTAPVVSGGTETFPRIMDTSKSQARMMMLVTAAAIKRSGRWRSLSLEIATPPGRIFDNFIIRAKHTTNTYIPSSWDNAGYTVLRQGPLDLTQTRGWVEIPFTTPLDYNGTSNVHIDMSFSNSGTAAGGSYVGTPLYGALVGTANTADGFGAPENWTSNNPYPYSVAAPNLRLSFGSEMPVTPTTTGTFVDGVWTGDVTLTQASGEARLVATNGAAVGQSATFEVGAVPLPAPVLTALPNVSTTTSRVITWNPVPTAVGYYAEAATDSAFTTLAANSGWITETTHTFTGLTHGTRYYFRVKGRKPSAESTWSNTVHTAMDTAAPVVTLGPFDMGGNNAYTTLRSAWTLDGKSTDTPAGIDSVRVTLNGFMNTFYGTAWGVGMNLPNLGSYPILVIATDRVNNTVQRQSTITRLADTDANGLPDDWQTGNGLALNGANTGRTADFDRDGLSNLLEYAFNTPPNSSTTNAPFSMVREVNNDDGKTYLVYRYNRRRGAVDLTYRLEFSSNLTTWSNSTFQTEEVQVPVANADGITDRVTLRILPDITQPQIRRVNVRLAVTSAAP